MMKDEDLFLGAWVSTLSDYVKITEIKKFIVGHENILLIYGRRMNGVEAGPFTLDALSPIPLSGDILIKNGFTEIQIDDNGNEVASGNKTDIFRYTKNDLVIEIAVYEPMHISIGYNTTTHDYEEHGEVSNFCKFNGDKIGVHELQQYLKFSGIDFEIKL